ncbi:MAG: hypothetical protein IIA59_12065 [Candidatus Marinimicrobia bacterium]|nr:hypothetical protein [Candidatus Neomarinimicrobiota bacterium]
MNILVSLLVGSILVFLGYRLGRRGDRAARKVERKVAKQEQEFNRIEGMLRCCGKIYTAANFATSDPIHASKLLHESRSWFDENCIAYRTEEPYKEFEFLLKWVSSYTSNSDVFAKGTGKRGSSLEMFDRITDLQDKLKKMLDEMK